MSKDKVVNIIRENGDLICSVSDEIIKIIENKAEKGFNGKESGIVINSILCTVICSFSMKMIDPLEFEEVIHDKCKHSLHYVINIKDKN